MKKLINGELKDRDQAVLDNILLVKKMAQRFLKPAYNSGYEFADLVNEGVIGLMKAFDEFDDTAGLQFSTFASWKIRGALSGLVRNGHDRGIRYPANVKELALKIKNNHLEELPIEEIAKELKLTVDRIKNAMEYLYINNELRLDYTVRTRKNEDGDKLSDLVGRTQDFSIVWMNEFSGKLSTREKEVFDYLLAGYNGSDIARKWGKSREWVRQIHESVRTKLNMYMNEEEVPDKLLLCK